MNNLQIFDILLGLFVLYSTVHFFFIQHVRTWKERSSYEKFITVAMIVFTVLMYMNTMSN